MSRGSEPAGRSVHVTYDQSDHERRSSLRSALDRLVDMARVADGRSKADFAILDAGCGVGLMLRDLARDEYSTVVGMDIDPRCVALSSAYANCQVGELETLRATFGEARFDLVLLSHVLEYVRYPLGVLAEIKSTSKKWVVLAVSNPVRPHVVMKYALCRRDYSNFGHVHSWDRSHFRNFLESFGGLEIVARDTDGVRFLPGRLFRAPLRRTGVLDRVEVGAGRMFPYLSTSLLVLCRIQEG